MKTVIKKFLQKIFKIVSYGIFFKIYGKIEETIESSHNNRIKTKTVNIKNDLKYKVYKITEGRLYTDRIHDTAFMLENRIIEGPSFQLRYTQEKKIYNSNIKNNVVFEKGTPRMLKNFNGSVLSLLAGGGGNNNYWHWLYNILPRLAICGKYISLEEVDYFLFPSLLKKFQNETLDYLNIPKSKRISSVKFRHIKAKELLVTEDPVFISGNATEDNQHIPSWIMLWLKDNFLNQNIVTNNKIKKKIYIDRSDTTLNHLDQRLIINEDEVRRYLLKNDFFTVKLHEIKFREQVDLFHNAECIVGLHGAGFANIVFCKSGTKVVEFRNASLLPVIENLAKKNDLNYYSIIAKEKHNYDFPSQQGSIQIPIGSLSKILDN